MNHPRTTAALLAFDGMVEAARACVATLPDAWLMPSSPGRAARTPPLISVGLLVHHTQSAALVRIEDQDSLFPPDGNGPWTSGHHRMAAAHALARLEEAAASTEDALRAFPTLCAGFSFGLNVPQPNADTATFESGSLKAVHVQAMGSSLTTGVERKTDKGVQWALQRDRLSCVLDLLAPFEQMADSLWIAVAGSVVAEAQNGWHEGRVALEPGDRTPNDPDPVVGFFDNALEAGGTGHAWRMGKQRSDPKPYMPMRMVPAASEEQAAALAVAGTVLFERLWDASAWGDLLASVECVRFDRL